MYDARALGQPCVETLYLGGVSGHHDQLQGVTADVVGGNPSG